MPIELRHLLPVDARWHTMDRSRWAPVAVSSNVSSIAGNMILAESTIPSSRAWRPESAGNSPWTRKTLWSDWKALLDPIRKFRPVGMTGVEINRTDARADFELLALNPDRGRPVLKDAAQRSLSLKTDEQDSRLVPPEPVLEAVPNATRIAHSTGGNDDMELAQAIERLALLHRLGEVDIPGVEAADEVFARIKVRRVLGKDTARFGGEGRVHVDRDGRKLPFAHQLDEIADQLLRALNRE